MFALAIFIGIYSYLIFLLGIFGVLYPSSVFWVTLLYVFIFSLVHTQLSTPDSLFSRRRWPVFHKKTSWLVASPSQKLQAFTRIKVGYGISLLLVVFSLQVLVNFVGALGPELAFDALWYHLTLPKLYILSHSISFIPGGLFYYSAMPKLMEMLAIPALLFGNEITVKLLHFIFGLMVCWVLYKLARKFFSPLLSLLAVVIFYSNLVIDWESITAYIDLARTFFELLGFVGLLNFFETKQRKWFVLSALMIGFAITTKVLALGSLGIMLVLLCYDGFKHKEVFFRILLLVGIYAGLALLVPLPWFVFSFVHTGNPVYPFFTNMYDVGAKDFLPLLINPITCMQNLWILFTHSPDPLSPLYIIFLPLIIFVLYKGKNFFAPTALMYVLLSLLVWYITPNTGGGRFIIPYLPVYSLLVAYVFAYPFPKWFIRILLGIVVLVAIMSIGYRGMANKRYLPVIFGRETKAAFLSRNLNFNFGDFYDIDGYFATHISPHDSVLLYGFHNEYYVDFPFVDNSYLRKGEKFDYVAVQHGTLPKRFANLSEIYHNTTTGVTLYHLPHNPWMSY